MRIAKCFVKRLFLSLFFSSICIFSFAQDKVWVKELGKLRADMMREVCKITEVNDADIINLIKEESVYDFIIKVERSNHTKLKAVVQNANGAFGIDFDQDFSTIRSIKMVLTNNLEEVLKKNNKKNTITSFSTTYDDAIKVLEDETKHFLNSKDSYLATYPNGRYKQFIPADEKLPTDNTVYKTDTITNTVYKTDTVTKTETKKVVKTVVDTNHVTIVDTNRVTVVDTIHKQFEQSDSESGTVVIKGEDDNNYFIYIILSMLLVLIVLSLFVINALKRKKTMENDSRLPEVDNDTNLEVEIKVSDNHNISEEHHAAEGVKLPDPREENVVATNEPMPSISQEIKELIAQADKNQANDFNDPTSLGDRGIEIDESDETVDRKFLESERECSFAANYDGWMVVGASVIGSKHLESDMPCQDSSYYENYGNGWGIAVVADGGSSCPMSHIGAKLAVKRCAYRMKAWLTKQKWIENNIFPTDAEWNDCAYKLLKLVGKDLYDYSKDNFIPFDQLGCTILFIVYSPLGIMASHIGDGRIGYQDDRGEWKTVFGKPEAGMSGQTIFITSESIWTSQGFRFKGLPVPESVVIPCNVSAFMVISDGCDNSTWERQTNTPYRDFCSSMQKEINGMVEERCPIAESRVRWYRMLKTNEYFNNERDDDDKSLVFACKKER